ncbi:MAG: hypothetical protein V1736_10695 [Pseudomonadota bacterium]
MEIQATFVNGGQFAICRLNEDRVIQGLPCRAGTDVSFYSNGRLWRCCPSGNFEFEGAAFEGETITELHKNGSLWKGRLTEDAGIQGIWCKGGERVEFSETGFLVKGVLARDSIIRGVPCLAGAKLWLAGGFPVRSTLSHSFSINGMDLCTGTEFICSANGDISGFRPAEDVWVDGVRDSAENNCSRWRRILVRIQGASKGAYLSYVTFGATRKTDQKRSKLGQLLLAASLRCKRETWVWFHSHTGTISGCILRNDTRFEDVVCRRDSEVNLHDNGKLLRCYLAGDQLIQGIQAKASTFVLFHKNGRLSACELAENMKLQGVPCRGRAWIGFHEDGSLKRCVLAEDKSYQGVWLKAGSRASFLPDGRLEEFRTPE